MSDPFEAQKRYTEEMRAKFYLIWNPHIDSDKDALTKEQLAFLYFRNGYETRRKERVLEGV